MQDCRRWGIIIIILIAMGSILYAAKVMFNRRRSAPLPKSELWLNGYPILWSVFSPVLTNAYNVHFNEGANFEELSSQKSAACKMARNRVTIISPCSMIIRARPIPEGIEEL